MKIDLPEGHHAILRDPKKVPERLRRPVTQALALLIDQARIAKEFTERDRVAKGDDQPDEDDFFELTPEYLNQADHLNDVVAVALIETWSYEDAGQSIPVTIETLLDLASDAYDLLRDATAVLYRDLIPDMTPKDAVAEDGEKREAHPFGSSNGSSLTSPVATP